MGVDDELSYGAMVGNVAGWNDGSEWIMMGSNGYDMMVKSWLSDDS